MSAPASEALCLACGLCCDGSLFRLVALGSGEADAMRSRGLVVSGVAGREHLKQPCAALSGFTCGAYDVRPAACRAYRCSLLRGVENGSLDPGGALRLVESHRGLAARLVEATGTGALLETLRTLEAQGDDSAGRLAHELAAR